ncbi:MAG: hypothetical protein KVP17_003299 [Porospora cf. gigantea B]|uniref:uncharacterized protein n=1 Tax=Porospora cf. gigantea B TaxID=2853592 RepID=UPI0035719098|nr:MAG: hypothetical protein KVP17_003299 [Porospora cf. gigantea B]
MTMGFSSIMGALILLGVIACGFVEADDTACRFALSKRGKSNAYCADLCRLVEFGDTSEADFSRECVLEYYDVDGPAPANACVGNVAVASTHYVDLGEVTSFGECQDRCHQHDDCVWVMTHHEGTAVACQYVSLSSVCRLTCLTVTRHRFRSIVDGIEPVL